MAVKPTAPRVMSGTYGALWWDGEMIFEVSSFEANLKVDREDVTFAGNIMKNSKLVSLSGEWTMKCNKVYSRSAELAKRIKAGEDVRATFIGKLADPDAFGSERVVLEDCWFGDLALMKFEVGSLLEEELTGGFSDFSFPDTVQTR